MSTGIVQKEKSKQALRVFLSYTSSDKGNAQKLRNILSGQHDLRIFTSEMLSAGENWQSKLRDEISQCDVFIALLSPKSVESGWVLSELGAAWALEKKIVPVFTQPDVLSDIPVKLKDNQSFEFKSLEDRPETLINLMKIMVSKKMAEDSLDDYDELSK